MSRQHLDIHLFISAECKKQGVGIIEQAYMLGAYEYATRMEKLTVTTILNLGMLVEPDKNKKGFRTVPVSFANGNMGLPANQISHCMGVLVSADSLSPEEFYKEFETIHPFVDGNGRVGAIIFNYLNQTLEVPIAPPNFW